MLHNKEVKKGAFNMKTKAEKHCNVAISAKGGGVWSKKRVNYGGDFIVINNYWRSCRDNTAVAYRQH